MMPNRSDSIPFLTIGIASYNYAAYLIKAFEQIKMQSFHDFEILYCDDGSTDHSITVIQQLIRTNPELDIRLVEGSHEGILANRNRIIDHARGKYLMICDADDFMLDACLKELCGAAQETNADCIIGGFQEMDQAGHILKSHIPSQNSCKWLYTWHHAQIYKTELLSQHRIRFTQLPDDVSYLQQIHLYSRYTVFVGKPLYAWVRHHDSASRDTITNPDWNPVSIWKKVSDCIAEIRQSVQSEADNRALTYYLYKWFYLNITDLREKDWNHLQTCTKKMQKQMKQICPDYRKINRLLYVLRTNDTFFARSLIALCWSLDALNLISLLPTVRALQNRFRQQKEHYGKTKHFIYF